MTPRGKTLGIAPGNDAPGELLKVFDGSWVSGWPRMTTIYHFFHHFGYHFSGREKTPKKAWTWLKFRPTFWGSEFWIYDVYTSYQTGYVYIYIHLSLSSYIYTVHIYTTDSRNSGTSHKARFPFSNFRIEKLQAPEQGLF